MPLPQNWLGLHNEPHMPQLRTSVLVSTHTLEHAVFPAAHIKGPVVPPPAPPPAPPPDPPPLPPPVFPFERHNPRVQTWPAKHEVHS